MYTYSKETFRGLLSFRKVFTKWNPVERFVAVAADGNARNDRATPRSLSLSPAPRIFLQGPEEFAECRRRSSSSAAGVSGRAASEPHGRKLFETEKLDIRCASWPRGFSFREREATGAGGNERREERANWKREGYMIYGRRNRIFVRL